MKRISEISGKPISMQHIIDRYHELQTFEDRDWSRRPSKLNCLHERNFMRKVEDNQPINAPQVASDLMVDCNIKVIPQRMSNAIKTESYNGCLAF